MIKQDFNINQRFEYLESLASMVISGVTPSLVVVGEGGLGKTHVITQCLKDSTLDETDYLFIKGYSTARGLYNTLFDNNGKVIIFDDCDSILEDKTALNILKSALDSYETRRISWLSKMNKNDEYPNGFDFKGQIIFISNKSKASIDQAILSRSLVVDLSMTQDEKIERMRFILPKIMSNYPMTLKEEVLDFLDKHKECGNLTLRSLIMICKVRATNPHRWKDLATYLLQA